MEQIKEFEEIGFRVISKNDLFIRLKNNEEYYLELWDKNRFINYYYYDNTKKRSATINHALINAIYFYTQRRWKNGA